MSAPETTLSPAPATPPLVAPSLTAPSPATSLYDRDAIFHPDGPFHPLFMQEAVRTLMRALPLDPGEPDAWHHRRQASTLMGLAALHPRDEIEVMLGVQALCAYHAAAVGWHLGMNQAQPPGSGLRHFSAAAARTFDTLLRALERRQARPLSVPVGRPAPRAWPDLNARALMADWHQRCAGDADRPSTPVVWTPEAIAVAEEMLECDRIAAENAGLDLANTEGILPGGGMIVPENPTPQQLAYLARRYRLMLKRERAENLRKGIQALPKIRPIRPGDLIP
jgi:hypothetical protein